MSADMTKPTVGRVVHYLMKKGEELVPTAAIVTRVTNGYYVDLFVFDPDQDIPTRVRNVPFSETGSVRYCWCWPPRVGS